MADEPIGFARYPGVERLLRATYTMGHGITPGIFHVEFAPQQSAPAATGTLTFHYDGTVIGHVGCRLDAASLTFDENGLITAATLKDRRWKWAYGECYGEYNVRDDERVIIPETQKSIRELAELLLPEMGEAVADLSALPTDQFPYVEWDGDVPAEELQELLDLCNCRVMFALGGGVAIKRYGEGADAPPGGVMRAGMTIDPPDPPDRIRVLFAHTIVQARLSLEAVGRDTDGSVVPIDDLSYKPEAGWSRETDLMTSVQDEEAVKLAKATVFRWYRVAVPEELAVPNVGTVAERKQIELLDEQVETYTDDDGDKRAKPPKVYGLYWIKNNKHPENSTRDENWEVPWDFRLRKDIGVIEFSETVKKFTGDADTDQSEYAYEEAELYLDIAFKVRHPETRAYGRYAYLYATGAQNGTGPETIDRSSEGGLKVYQKREAKNKDDFTWEELPPASQLDKNGLEYAKEAHERYLVATGQTIDYAGIRLVPHDGRNVQVTWTVGPEGATTSLAQGMESAPRVPKYAQRRTREWQRRAARRERRRQATLSGRGNRVIGGTPLVYHIARPTT